ncbi:hypothetical protein H072_10499 [Dactylellina haptotyla CBS 200.50]|uniref:RRM domain-containing protein n=1 Tax=Dactylellina haptotyla (strain CBS 200.50) TaxID=1284197 RepID=S7ZZA6_DACHA|nr:hypothetical protein H072_10499 [Dactylellina haptotyla CBS 200.50]
MAEQRNNTVYCRNLEESVKIPVLTATLETLFSQYGNILEIVAKKNLRARGQAFVVFDSVDAAERAIKEVQGFNLFEKPMVLQYAKTKSDATVEVESNEAEFEAHKRRRLAEKERKQAIRAAEAQKHLKRPAQSGPSHGLAADSSRPTKKAATAAPSAPGGLKSTAAPAAPQIPDEYLPPNKILFLQNLPDNATSDILNGIFGSFEGFKEVRLVPGRKGIAFVEYENEAGAISAKENTQGMSLGPDGSGVVKVTYQRQ